MLPTRPAAALPLRPAAFPAPLAAPVAPGVPVSAPSSAPADALAVMCPDCGTESTLHAVLAGRVPGCPGCGYRYTVAAAVA